MKAGGGGRPTLLVVGALLTGALAGCAAPDGTPPTAPSPDATPDGNAGCELDAVGLFAKVPAPGRPFAVAVHEGITYAATGANFHYLPPDRAQRVFAFGPDGTLIDEVAVQMLPGGTMGLSDLAVDSSEDGARLYMVDMMGRVLRSLLGPARGELGEAKTYATIPAPTGESSMPAGMAFDPEGNAYLTDDFGRVWKIQPGGSPSVWFESPRLQGPAKAGPSGLGANGARIGPDGKLYVSVSASGELGSPGAGIVFRIPVGPPPQESDLDEVVRIAPRRPPTPPDLSEPFFVGIAFGASGRLYVTMANWDEIAVVSSDGTVERTISDPLIANPFGLAFLGNDLLVANVDGNSVVQVCVQEAGLPLHVPSGIPR